MTVDDIYKERSERYAGLRDRCAVRSRWLGNLRLVAFLAAAAALIGVFEAGLPFNAIAGAAFAASAIIFVVLITRHQEMNRRRGWYDALSKLNEEGIARMARDWDALTSDDDGSGADPEHPFANDLDIFGRASLFSLLSTVGSPPGRETLRDWLLEPTDPAVTRERQSAVAELDPLIDLREELTVRGRMISAASSAGTRPFLDWAEGEPWLTSQRWVVWTARLTPLLALALMALNAAGLVSYLTWIAVLVFNLTFTFTKGKAIHEIFDRAFARERTVREYAELFQVLTKSTFEAGLLRQTQEDLTAEGTSAHVQMDRLHRLLVQADVRLSMLYLPIQALTLWDFHVLLRLEKWQLRAGSRARSWMSALGASDAMAALAALKHDNPGWVFPEISDGGTPVLAARGLGHPLIPDLARVANDVEIGPPGTFLFITGSNMSGKSTLLRAIGTNVVLARAGAPVCAAEMKLPPVTLETSMRIHDSLQQGLSHFMAELQRLKAVVETARRVSRDGTGTLLYLLDDILQGTNTSERRIAARKIVTHLLAERAIGGVTSHDLTLADSEELCDTRTAVHFTERIEETADGAAISFDYKLRPGVATSKNALKLLEIVGLGSSDDGPGSERK
jgi:ABC-type Na+ transport system ATPase subunit NatA